MRNYAQLELEISWLHDMQRRRLIAAATATEAEPETETETQTGTQARREAKSEKSQRPHCIRASSP